MRTGVAFSLSFILIAALLTGCAVFRGGEQRAAWRGDAERACMRSGIVQMSAYVQKAGRVNGPGACGIDMPLKVGAAQKAGTHIRPAATINCPMTAATDLWAEQVVQPAALMWFGSPVVSMRNVASYGCRTRNHRRGARLSEHAFGNALDISAFTLANGRTVTVLDGWRGAPDEQGFLREVHIGACARFATVLGPGSDGAHEDHFHFDLARHNANGTYKHCRPRTESITMPDWPPQGMPAGPAKW